MIKVDEGQANINVKVAPESQIAVGIDTQKKIDVIVGDAAKMDCQRAINYIKSGEAEIDAYVDGTAKPAIDSYVNTTSKAAIDDYVANTAEPAIDAYVTNTAEPAIDSYVTNTAIPQVDSYVSLAKQWAIGDPTEPVGNSAKYWAEEAATTVSNMANKDLSNLSATGEAKFAAKQDVISDLSTIRSGAALGATAVQSVTTGTTNGTIKVDGNAVSVYGLGSAAYTSSTDYDAAGSASTAETSAKNYADSLASNYATAAQGAKADTAVQPSDLATVATTGSYDDLTNKPTIPAAQVNSDWNANSGVAQILNKPTIPTVNNATLTITQGGVSKGTFTANASSDVTIALDAGGGGGGAVWGGITGDIDDQTDLKNALDAKQDVISDLATIRSGASAGATAVQSVTTGTTNGTIKVDGTDVSVYGLGSAAYTASTAYDVAGSASTAETNAKNYADSLSSNYATAAQGAKADTAVQPSDLATVATTGDYDDLLNTPTIPTVNNATLTIQKNGVDVQTFTANASTNATANITVPTDTGDLTNGAGFITGITSGDVTTALGYTPYSDANPNGYTSNVGTVTSVNNTSPDGNGNVTLSIPAAQVNSDWNAVSGVAEILNKPSLATVATSGAYSDLTGTPTIPTVNNATINFTQGGVSKGSITLNQATDQTIALDAGGGGGGGSYTAGDGIDITNDVISVDAEDTAEVDVQSIVEVDTESLQETTAEDLLKLITGYDANATQTLKNINGSIQWVTD